MTAPPANINVTLMPDAHAYLIRNALHIASTGGNVSFQPLASMPADMVAAIASQIIAVAEDWRDQALAKDAQDTGRLLEQTRRSL
jgi:hypothetical protein